MSLKDTIHAEMIAAMKSGDKVRRETLRLALAGFTKAETSGKSREALTDAEQLKVVEQAIGQIRKSIPLFEQAGDATRVAHAHAEIAILDEFVPTKLDEDATHSLVLTAIAGAGATSISDMGKVMGLLKKSGDDIDMALASRLIKAELPSEN